MRRTFTLEYWQDEGWYVGQLREVPGVFSQGETLTELEENIRDAHELVSERPRSPDRLDARRVRGVGSQRRTEGRLLRTPHYNLIVW